MSRSINFEVPRRYLVCTLIFFGVFILYAMRLNLGVAVVAMTTTYKSVRSENGSVIQVKEFDWNQSEKGYILGSFYYGYILAEFTCGWLSHQLGGRIIFGLQLAMAGLFTIGIPLVAAYGPYAVLIFRASAGLFEGGLYPSTQSIWSRWAPINERTRLATWSYNGSYLASVVCFPLYGLMATYWGWQMLFYVPGAVSLVLCLIWFLNVKSDPAEDSKISISELEYIKGGFEKSVKRQIPWDKMLTSMPFWSIVIIHITQSWGYIIMFTFLPSFFNDIWQVTVEESGFLLTIPAVVGVLVMPMVGVVSDYLMTKKRFSRTSVRKFCQVIAGFGSAITISLIAVSPTPILAICSLIAFECVDPFVFGSYYVSPLDIAPDFAGIITGIACTSGSLSGVISPIVTGYIVKNKTHAEWTIVLLISAVMYLIGTVFYLIFASGEIQPWARNDREIQMNVRT